MLEYAALCTTKGSGNFNGTMALFLTTTTGLGARGEGFPGSKLAVDRTGLYIASSNLFEVRARFATVDR